MENFEVKEPLTGRVWSVGVYEKEGTWLIEFVDTTHNQFVSEYIVETFYSVPDGEGIILNGTAPDLWVLTSQTVLLVKDWVDSLDILW